MKKNVFKVRYPGLSVLVLFIFALLNAKVLHATDCTGAIAISTTLPATGALVCGATDDINSSNSPAFAGVNDGYKGGNEALYTFTPTVSGSYDIAINSTATWTSIWIFSGCPTDAGTTTVAAMGSTSGGAKTLSATLTAGITYYIMFDTWPSPASPCATGSTYTVALSPAMSYVSSTTEQSSTAPVAIGAANQRIIRTSVVVIGAASPLSLTQINYTTSGSTSAATDIANAKVYYTGTSTTFSTTTAFGSVVSNPDGSFSVSGSQVLTGGGSNTTNYFWLVYDIGPSATAGNVIDATCESVTLSSGTFVPATTNPTGTRTIVSSPANDECSGAIAFPAIPVDGTCASVTANTLGGTESQAACTGSGADDDIWYSFVCPAGTTSLLFANTTISGNTDRVVQFFSGTCSGLTSMLCSDPESGTLSGLTPGNTYYFRIHTYSSETNAEVSVCLKTPPPPPVNDDCAGAVSLTVNPDYSCGITTAGTTVGATASSETAPTCGASGTNDDVWFSFVATNTNHRVVLSGVSGSTDMAMAAYSGACGGLTGLSCSDPNTMDLTGLTVGSTYYVRVWTWSSTATTSASFNICVGTAPPPPANDEASGAISLTVNPDLSCAAATSGTTTSATPSSDAAPTCSATGTNDDVWYSFVAAGPVHRISFSGTSSTMAAALYTGTPGSLTFSSCASTTLSATGLTAGTTYYIRAYTTSSTATTMSDFEICVGTPPPPPANDEISGAVSLTVNPDYDCGAVTAATTVSATASSPAPSCTVSGANDDVWFSFTATQTSHRVSVINTGGSSDMNMVVYTDNTAATEVPGGGTCENVSVKNLTGLTIGQTYFIRIYTWSSTATTTSDFDMCVGTPPPPPANDEASGAVTLTLGSGCTGAAYTNSGGTQSASEPFGTCSSDQGFNTVWYKFVAPASGAVKISTDFDGGTLTDTRVALFSATNAADYTTFQIISCDDDGGDLENFNSIVYATGLTSGTTYYIQVDVYDGDTEPGSYCITVDELSSAMISATNTCSSTYETPVSLVTTTYTGWISLVDGSGNLVALVRNATGIDPDDLSPAQNVHTGTIRADDNGDTYLDRNFRINYSGTVTDPFEVQLFFLNSELTAYGEDLADLNITRITGTTCSADLPATGDRDLLSQSGNGAAGDVRWITFTTPSFSNFFVGSSTEPLAITLGNISAINQGNVNIIHWNTLKEVAGDRFELERSTDGRSFVKIADINAKGVAGNYEYTDEEPMTGVNFYRILMINTDGGRFYSDVVNATVGNTGKGIEAFPNPASKNLTIHIRGGIGSNAVITIADITGRIVSSVSDISSDRIELSLEGLAQGIYFVKYADDHFSQTIKVTKK